MTEFEVEFDAPEPEPPAPSPKPETRIVTKPQRRRAVEEVAPEPVFTAPVYIANGSRTLPSSIEAEESLLSCAMIDGPDVLQKCREARLTSNSFYLPNHGIVYNCMCSIVDRGIACEAATVAEELQRTRQLDYIGGIPFITQVSSRIPTTAQASYFIEEVRKYALRREIIRLSTGAVERSYNCIDPVELLAEVETDIRRLTDGNPVFSRQEIDSRAFDPKRQIPKPVPIYTLAGTTICTPGNITAIYSQAKTGKSSFIGAMMSASMTNPTAGRDTLGIVGPNYSNHAVLHFDTEQSPYDWQQLVKSSLRRVGSDKPPAWLMSYILTGMPAPQCRDFIEASLKRAKKIHGDIHSVIIDGVADLVVDPNDPAECFPLITRLHALAIEYNTALILVLHLNPGAEANAKGRGHLGSQLERKAESNLTMDKVGEVTRVWATKQRGKTISKNDAPAFTWSSDDQMHVSTTLEMEDAPPKIGRGRKQTYSFSEMKLIFPAASETPKRMKELHRIALQSVPIKNEGQFYNVLQRFVQEGSIQAVEMPGGRGYRLAI